MPNKVRIGITDVDEATGAGLPRGHMTLPNPSDAAVALRPQPGEPIQMSAALVRDRDRMREWARDGTLLSAEDFARGRGTSCTSLREAELNGDLFSTSVDGQSWYLAVFLTLDASDVGHLCRGLSDIAPMSKTIFFLHKHGALGGLTVAEALPGIGLTQALKLTENWRLD